MTKEQEKDRDKLYVERKKKHGYARISVWVKKDLVKHIKGLIYLESMKDDHKDIEKLL